MAAVNNNKDNKSSGHWQRLKAAAEGDGGRMMGGVWQQMMAARQ
jgi:hypothetical protein